MSNSDMWLAEERAAYPIGGQGTCSNALLAPQTSLCKYQGAEAGTPTPPRRWAPIGYSPATQNQPAPALSDLHNVKTNFVVAAGFRVSFELRPASAS